MSPREERKAEGGDGSQVAGTRRVERRQRVFALGGERAGWLAGWQREARRVVCSPVNQYHQAETPSAPFRSARPPTRTPARAPPAACRTPK